MFCSGCGKKIEENTKFCEGCGTNIQNPKVKNSVFKKVLMITGGIGLAVMALIAVIFVFVSATSDRMVCRSPEGNITIMYNSQRITGYTTRNMSFNMPEQQSIVQQIGIEEYLDEFAVWFSNNTTGTCER